MIKEIRFTNMKGQSANQPLEGMDFFIGRNGSGKTTRLQALGLALLGYVPGNGKKAQDTFKLATGEAMSAGLKMKNGFTFDRFLTRNVKENKKQGTQTVSINESVSVAPGRGEKTDTQKKGRIQEEVGSFPVMMDFSEFLSLSDAKRRDFMYSLSPITSSAWRKDKVRAFLMNELAPAELKTNNEELYTITVQAIEDALAQFPDDYGISEGLQAMIDWTAGQLSFWKSKVKDSQGAVRQLADLKNQQEETDRAITEEKAELNELQEQLVKATGQLNRDQERIRQNEKRLQRIEELKGKLEALQQQEAQTEVPPNYDREINFLKEQLRPVPDKSADIATIQEEQAKLKADTKAKQDEINDLYIKHRTLISNLESLKRSVDKVNELDGSCIIHANIACPKDFTGFADYVAKKEAAVNEEAGLLEQMMDERKIELHEMEASIAACEGKIQDLRDEVNAIRENNNKIQGHINELTSKRDAYNNARERYANQVKVAQDELERLQNERMENAAPVDVLEKQIEGLRNRIDQLKTSTEEKAKARQAILLMQQSMLDNREADYKATAFKDIDKCLGPKGIQGELVKEILAPLTDDIRSNLQLMGFDLEPYFETESDTGQEIFQFGWTNKQGHRVNFDALSTGQQTIYLAALMTTIIDRAQPKLRVLAIDNVNHLDAVNLQLALNGISQLSDKFDNIILAGAVASEFEAEGWRVWNLDEQPVKAEEVA